MDQVDPGRYRVSLDEEVTVRVTGHGVINSAGVFGVDADFTVEDAKAGIYKFKVTAERHIGRLSCRFPQGTGDKARIDTTLQGSEGGDFAGPSVPSTSKRPVRNFRFEVA